MKTSRRILPATPLLALLALLPALHPADASAGDREWATAGKILTGVVAADILLNHAGPANRPYGRQTYYAPPTVYVAAPYYGGPAASYREFAPVPPPLTGQPQPQPQALPAPQQPPLPQAKELRLGADGACTVDGRSVAPDALKTALAGLDRQTPVTVVADRSLAFQQVVTVLDTVKALGFPNVALLAAEPQAKAAAAPAAPMAQQPPAPKTVRIGADGACSVDGKAVPADGLKAALAGTDAATPVIVEPVKATPYQSVVDALDALQAAGLKNLSVRAAPEPTTAPAGK